jgi:hypothetical protein
VTARTAPLTPEIPDFKCPILDFKISVFSVTISVFRPAARSSVQNHRSAGAATVVLGLRQMRADELNRRRSTLLLTHR